MFPVEPCVAFPVSCVGQYLNTVLFVVIHPSFTVVERFVEVVAEVAVDGAHRQTQPLCWLVAKGDYGFYFP